MDFSMPYTMEFDLGLGISFAAEVSGHVFEVPFYKGIKGGFF